MSAEQYAPAVLQAGRDLGITERGIVIAFATVYVESDWFNYANYKVDESLDIPHDAIGSDGYSVGLFQQQVVLGGSGWWWGDAATCMDPYKSAALFFQRLKKLDYNGPNSPGSYAQRVQSSAFPDRYDQRIDDAQQLYDRISGATPEVPVDPNRPDYNEYPVWSPNSQDRGGTPVDLFLIHTQEADSNADQLAHWLAGDVGVSYHYTISQDPNDHGVTVCDVVDTDEASWSVLSANNRSINLCFAGSRASWTRVQWLQQGLAIDVAAYLAVQDCRKYGIGFNVIKPPYVADPPGISDHRYVTQHLGDGTHTDVGDNFPWDVFGDAVAKYAGQQPAPAPAPAPAPTPNLEQDIWDQLRLPWNMLGGHTLVEAVAQIRDKVCGTNDRDKGGAL